MQETFKRTIKMSVRILDMFPVIMETIRSITDLILKYFVAATIHKPNTGCVTMQI